MAKKRAEQRTFHIRILGILLFTILLTTGASCFKKQLTPPGPVELTIWRSEDSKEDIEVIAQEYQKQYSNVTFTIKTFKKEEYEDELFRAWSKGEGPDIFSVPNWKMGKYREFISPMPASVKLKTAQTTQSFLKEETIVKENSITFPVPPRLKDQFVDVVASDVVFENKIYGLPMSIDTLALFYNRDLLAKSQIAIPPTTWEEFRDAVQAIVRKDDENKIIQPAAALGTANNVPYSFDILSALMMQNGTTMVENNRSRFDAESDNKKLPGVEALDFYAKFSNPSFETYTWNAEQLEALEAFTQGNLAFYFGYQSDIKQIQQRSPNLNYSYTYLPQIDSANPINIPNYAVETVHLNSKNPQHAWNFIYFATSKEQAKVFSERTTRIPATRSLIAEKQKDPIYEVFATQALTAKSWYHGKRPEEAIGAFAEMITTTNQHASPLEEIIKIASDKVQLTLE